MCNPKTTVSASKKVKDQVVIVKEKTRIPIILKNYEDKFNPAPITERANPKDKSNKGKRSDKCSEVISKILL